MYSTCDMCNTPEDTGVNSSWDTYVILRSTQSLIQLFPYYFRLLGHVFANSLKAIFLVDFLTFLLIAFLNP